jgi:hypothetical protein
MVTNVVLVLIGGLLLVQSRILAKWAGETFGWQPWPHRYRFGVYLWGYRVVGAALALLGVLSWLGLMHFR